MSSREVHDPTRELHVASQTFGISAYFYISSFLIFSVVGWNPSEESGHESQNCGFIDFRISTMNVFLHFLDLSCLRVRVSVLLHFRRCSQTFVDFRNVLLSFADVRRFS